MTLQWLVFKLNAALGIIATVHILYMLPVFIHNRFQFFTTQSKSDPCCKIKYIHCHGCFHRTDSKTYDLARITVISGPCKLGLDDTVESN
ncbi:hypothetical protein FKM82_031355 [Ascaphus truei]